MLRNQKGIALIALLGIIAGAVILLAFIVGGWIMSGYNGVVTMDEATKSQWAQVENQMKRRYDLIPNLVEIVKGYAGHEKEIFEHIADARTKYFQASSVDDKIAASKGLEGALSRLLMLQETYPQLKANENFLKLQDSLEGTENRIAVARMRYNETAQTLNTYIRTVFGRIFAGFAGVTPVKYFEISEAEKDVPKIKF